ncbi:MAG: hypothetical protein RL572_57 [Pseudomonadota bacterium]|jgi:MFS family permease
MTEQLPPYAPREARARTVWLRPTLRSSQKEAVASATMTATGDNFFNAFAIYLNATAAQMGWLMAIPQLFGALFQILSAWLGNYLPRKPLVVTTAGFQALVVFALAVLALTRSASSVPWLIGLCVLYFSCLNFIQPQWRAWMGSIVPQRRRGAFFASRTRLTMMASLAIFVSGGALLSLSERLGVVWLGFALLFAAAGAGRVISARLLTQMHDPDPVPHPSGRKGFWQSLLQMRASLKDRTFREYSFFVAGMQGVVAISAPFFAVYMLRDLQFTYLEYSLNAIASILTQFLTLSFWGRFSDRFGNRLVMLFSSIVIPVVPLLWLFSPDHWYLIGVQMVSGFVWSGYSLSTANYLYDIRPHKSDFAVYAAMQSALSAVAVFGGALLGGLIATAAPHIAEAVPFLSAMRSPLFIVFVASFLLRVAVSVWFIPRAAEPRVRRRPKVLQVIYRVTRFSAISGIALDWLSVTRRGADKRSEAVDDSEEP